MASIASILSRFNSGFSYGVNISLDDFNCVLERSKLINCPAESPGMFHERIKSIVKIVDFHRVWRVYWEPYVFRQSSDTTKIHVDPRVSPTAEINSKAQVDSLVGDDTKIDERTSIKRSTIGTHCTIGNNVKISKSILMDNIVIED
ncbi:8169_t:CDS:2, partial [Gigaspora margarita]